VAQVAVCSQINTKHINTAWTERAIFECNSIPVGASPNPYAIEV